MAQVVEKVRRIRKATEAAGSFAVEQSIGSFTDTYAREDSVKMMLNRPMESPLLLQQHLDGYPSKVFMPKTAEIDFATNLVAALVRQNGVVSNFFSDYDLWATSFGGVYLGTGSTIASTSTAITLNVTSAAGMREGSAIACATGTGGAWECREIKTISSNAVTLKRALSAAPITTGATSIVSAAATFYYDHTDGSLVKTLQLAVEGLGSTDRWLLKGGAPKAAPSFEITPGGIPQIKWSYMFADWKPADGTNTTMNLQSAAISDQALSDAGVMAVMDSELAMRPNGSTSATVIDGPTMSITPTLKYGPHKTPGGTNTVKQWVRLRNDGPPVTAEFSLPYESATWFTARDAETAYGLSFQLGSSSTYGAVLLTVPTCYVEDVQREEADGLASQKVKLYARLDSETTTNSNNLQRSPFRVHIF